MRRLGVALVAVVAGVTCGAQAGAEALPSCSPGGAPVSFSGRVTADDARSYRAVPFVVAPGTTRIEVTYDWVDPLPSTPLTETVLDLGLWDGDGLGAPTGFRGWSGSRAGRVSEGQPPVFVQPDVAARGYHPGPIEPGTWWVDLGIAAVGPAGADWSVRVACSNRPVGPTFTAEPVDAAHVADPAPGWHHADFHMHGFHSHQAAPPWDVMVAQARTAGLDVLPITEYVTAQHWDELGPVQSANPDLLIWPSREIITYFGHAIALGETRSVLDYRHGAPGVSLAAIQSQTVSDGALFGIAHPTFFPGPAFRTLCRGCEFELEAHIDWDHVTTLEVLTGPILVSSQDAGLPETGLMIENPFVATAIDLWEDRLLDGHRITATSGSDSKGVEDGARRLWGTNATAVYSEELSRASLADALAAGHAYVRTRGAREGPEVHVTARAPDGTTGMYGDSLAADRAEITVVVRGGDGELIELSRNGTPAAAPVLVTGDPFRYRFSATRHADEEGPLGTFWRVDVRDPVTRSLSTIGNPIFLTGRPGAPPRASAAPADELPPAGRADVLPATGADTSLAPVLAALLLAGGLATRARRR